MIRPEGTHIFYNNNVLETFWFSSATCQYPRALSPGRGKCPPCFTLSSSAAALLYLLSLLPVKQPDAPVGSRHHADRRRNVQQQLQTCRAEQNHTDQRGVCVQCCFRFQTIKVHQQQLISTRVRSEWTALNMYLVVFYYLIEAVMFVSHVFVCLLGWDLKNLPTYFF